LRLYTTYIEPVAQTFAYSLLRNHFHMIVYIKTIEEQAADVQASNPERDPFSPRSPS
jgi:hypothetical protein